MDHIEEQASAKQAAHIVPLSVISAYSLLQSPTTIKDLVATAKARGYQAIALTDVDVLYGVVDFFNAAQQAGIKPLIGLTINVVGTVDKTQQFPLTLIAKNAAGYQNLIQISSAKMTLADGAQLTTASISEWLTNIVVINGLESELGRLLSTGQQAAGETVLAEQMTAADVNSVYLGVSDQQSPVTITSLQTFAKQQEVPLVAVNAVRYLNPDDQFKATVMQAIDQGEQVSNLGAVSQQTGSWYLREAQPLTNHYAQLGLTDAVLATQQIADEANVDFTFQAPQLPRFKTPDERSTADFLHDLCEEGLAVRLGAQNPLEAQYQKRLDHELTVIHELGFDDYFLIVWDVMNYAHQHRITTGPGRGSAAGSLVAYCLAITEVDPLAYDLLFERFLNDQRAQMPDIDLDIPDDKRDQLLLYVRDRYGADKVGQIITFGTLGAKQVIRDVGRVFGLSTFQLAEWSRTIPGGIGVTLTNAQQNSQPLRNLLADGTLNQLLFDTALALEGLPRHTSTHAAGVVLSDQPLTDIVPVQAGSEGLLVAQFPKNTVEALGLLKMDFLGLRNLTILANTLAAIQQTSGDTLSVNDIPLNDAETLHLFQKGDTNGVFQFESSGIKNVLRQLHPETFELVVAVNALYRPGPMENIDRFIARKKGQDPVTYPDHALEPILGPTYGIIVYQEQVMRVASVMGGFSMGKADLLRRAMSKKDHAKIDALRDEFIAGATQKGFTQAVAVQVYDYIENFASYGFNRSHAVAYTKMAFELAYLKVHHSAAFFMALLNSVMGNPAKTKLYLLEAKQHGVNVAAPNVNVSQADFSLVNGQIVFGLRDVKGLRRDFIANILAVRETHGDFTGLEDFVNHIEPQFRKEDILSALIYAGAFDNMGLNRAELLDLLPRVISGAQVNIDLFETNSGLKLKVEHVKDLSLKEKLAHEAEVLGAYLSGHPVEQYTGLARRLNTSPVVELTVGQQATVLLYTSRIREIRTKKGDKMAFVSGNDPSGELSITIFPRMYQNVESWIAPEQVVVVTGKIDTGRQLEIVADKLQLASDLNQAPTQSKEPAQSSGTWYLQLTAASRAGDASRKFQTALPGLRGANPVILHEQDTGRTRKLGADFNLSNDDATKKALTDIFGANNVVFKAQ
ncbi:DNA polymerase III subunit alpha [Furfurilactobacillus siliginis]|uniref:DNA polymerase III subunit alpha n=1 Tax=Furfurilactobacillus siliginis TaxID=348151 RepID=A0A0R2L5H8_9LACO|nr:DNA polymerase III subunit alpha [Furfurilactobacillus siliginis]KRN97032.1 dna-directed dna polymerase iii, alpha chain [Furfurilactobacillus siliginis]GEK27792.1 DNA-directed DNA polymerase [Furfurilactobacillus siliginis]